MIIERTSIPDVLLITNKRFGDARGYFSEILRQDELNEAAGYEINFVQVNESVSSANILRGIHFQNPHPQGKLVRVVAGEVFDVAVDLRQNSPTFGQWVGEILSAENGKQLWVPEGFGHGFYVTSEKAHFVYLCTDYYHPQSEQCIRFDDPSLNIKWPLNGQQPLTSPKDMNGISFNECLAF